MLDELQGTRSRSTCRPCRRRCSQADHRQARSVRPGLRAIIQQGIDQGLFRPGDPKMIGFAIMGAVNWITKWFDPAGPMTSEQIGQRFADYLVGGLLKSSTSARTYQARSSAWWTVAFRGSIDSDVWPLARLQFQDLDAPSRCCFSCSGVPVSSGNVPQCIGTTCLTPSHFAAIAAVSGPIVKRSPIGRNAMSGL